MAAGKEIRTKIKSIQNTQKITKAMEMVAASKMRKAQDRMSAARPYAERIKMVVSHIAASHPEYKHPYLHDRQVKRIGLIVVSSDRGLCGGLNINVFKKALAQIADWEAKGYQVDVVTFGAKALSMFSRVKSTTLIAEKSHLGDTPEVMEVIGPVQAMLQDYAANNVDEIHIVSNVFENTMTQTPTFHQLVPIVANDSKALEHHWDYIYEPDSKEVLDSV
ncbi:MAG: ATP synthase F1 subunit gamma, partial [Gammaproteobacteria bacterium]|nr:ATP synthase F1 subunit gamma [Gammaproteobacteria bacterium]